ncbi:hypothetical protein A3K63_01065 [Candidatus Micrarchaeota archaeon RBG_16_49_10]|nr:MAG: hypothetical protein A3K63_01065 [Candidatus Micrarchaeota archaeon RBG_16_49_10]
MISLEEVRGRLEAGEALESVLVGIEWQDFEQLVSKIFEEHEYKVRTNFRFKTEKRWEIDVFAVGRLYNFGVDCKFWNRGRYKKSALKEAVNVQKERCEELGKFLKGNEIAKRTLKMAQKKVIPLLITWFEEDIAEYNNVIVVPAWKLNEFLLNCGDYL